MQDFIPITPAPHRETQFIVSEGESLDIMKIDERGCKDNSYHNGFPFN